MFINVKVVKEMGGNNALLYAVSSTSSKENESFAIVKYLIQEAKADPDSMNDYNVNCLILASKKS